MSDLQQKIDVRDRCDRVLPPAISDIADALIDEGRTAAASALADSYSGMNKNMDQLRADKAELVEALNWMHERCAEMLSQRDRCGDPGSECPMQDAGKGWHLRGDLEAAANVLNKHKESSND